MIKGSIQEDTTIINIYATNIEAPQYIGQMLKAIKEDIDSNTKVVGDFYTSLTPLDRSSLTPRLHHWTDHPDRKLIRKHKL